MIFPIIYALSFGTGDALVIHGPLGAVSKRALALPRIKGGRTPAMEFPMIVEALFKTGGDVVVESAAIGSSGCEPSDMIALIQRYPDRKLFTLSNRAVKNYRRDNGLAWKKGGRYALADEPQDVVLEPKPEVRQEDAEILYLIATGQPDRLYHWTGPSAPLTRVHRSVRPMDKHLYRDTRAVALLALLPPFESLPEELREVLGTKREGYSRTMVIPFAMATTEPYLDSGPLEERRRRYEKIIGLYDRGYPSFYRRATIVWMTAVAKLLTGAKKKEEVTPEQRKEAWKTTQRQIRWFFHLTMEHQGRNPVTKGAEE